MANEVFLSVRRVEVLKEQTAPRFEVIVDGAKLGELRVSKGGVRWIPRNHQEDAHHLSWEQFDALMREQPRR